MRANIEWPVQMQTMKWHNSMTGIEWNLYYKKSKGEKNNARDDNKFQF